MAGQEADLDGLVGDGVVGLADAAAEQVQPGGLVLDMRGQPGRCSLLVPNTPADGSVQAGPCAAGRVMRRHPHGTG